MNLRDFFEEYPIFALNLCESFLHHLLILLLVDLNLLRWMILRDWFHLCQLLSVQTQIFFSPFA